MSILVIADHTHNELSPFTLNTMTAARLLAQHMGSCRIDMLVCGHNADGAAQQAAAIPGVGTVFRCESEGFAEAIAENIAPVVISLIDDREYQVIMTSAGTTGKNIMPRIAALKDSQQISDIIEVEDKDTFKRPIYAGNAIATVQSQEDIKFITIRSTAFEASDNSGGEAQIEDISARDPSPLSIFVKKDVSESERPDLATADVVVSGGRALGSTENFKLIEDLADKLGGAIGASRAAVDAGYVPNDMQVGQTGKVVAPQLYIAVGISGAIQHLAGMKDSKTIVAINKDADAPIFSIADYGLVGDLFEIVPELTEKL